MVVSAAAEGTNPVWVVAKLTGCLWQIRTKFSKTATENFQLPASLQQ